jgi:hypothetical protein
MLKDAIALGLVVACAACSKSLVTTSAGDGGADAGPPPPYAGPFEAHIVARTLSWRTQLVPRRNGVPVLAAGIFRYELTAAGTAKRLGDDASYVTQMPGNDDRLSGYDVHPVFADEPISGTYPWWDLRGPTTGRVRPERLDVRLEVDLPEGIEGDDLRRAVDGTSVVVAQDPKTRSVVVVVAAPGLRDGRVVRIPELDERHLSSLTCQHIPSWQRPHLLCRSWTDTTATVHRLVGDRWELVRIPSEIAEGLRVGAVARDGTLWLGAGAKVVRVGPTGVVDTLSMPMPEAKLARASYSSSGDYYGRLRGAASIDDGPAEPFVHVDVNPATAPKAITVIAQIVPRADGEAWVLAQDGSSNLVVHLGHPAIAPLPEALFVGTETDQRNELRNTRPPIPWVGHCAQLFVALAKQRVDGSLASEAVWSREPAIAAAISKAMGKEIASAPSFALVEGRLGGRRVAGVLGWRASSWVSEDLLEKVATALAADLASFTGMPPEITCTAPVLERASRL